jgi:hypothetical protein
MALSRCSQRPTTVAGERRIFFYFPLDKSHFITVEKRKNENPRFP